MNRQEFLQALDAALSTLVPDRERQETLRYYEEYFEEAGPEREAEVIQELGDPVLLAQKIAREGGFSSGEGTQKPPKRSNRLKWMLGIAGAVVVLLAGTFATLSALNAQFLFHFDFLPGFSSPSASQSQTSGHEPSAPVAEDFIRLDIEIGVGNVTVRTGADWELTLESSGQNQNGEDYLLHYTLEEHILTIWSTPRSLNSDVGSDVEGQVVVTVPEGWSLEQVDIKNGTGSIELDGLEADKIATNLGMGTVEGSDLTAGSLAMANGMGDITLQGPLATHTELESGMGGVDVDTDSSLASCAYDLQSGMGGVRIDGSSFAQPQSKADGGLSLTVNTGMGDITVDFGG